MSRPDGAPRRGCGRHPAVVRDAPAAGMAHLLLQDAIPGLLAASCVRNLIEIDVPEGEYRITLSGGPDDDRVRMHLWVTFRQASGGAGTWWTDWVVEMRGPDTDPRRMARILAQEINDSRRLFTRMVAGAATPYPVSPEEPGEQR